ncbi:MAG: RNA polymerase sigma factor [Bacteroidetes bacterium]|nr:RNA polymerase sigma factor [Bacteroidota bacterium]
MNKESISMQGDISDNEIITSILNGEKELYAIIVRRYNQRLYRIGMSMLNDDADVEDAMQVAYIHAYESLGSFGFRSGFSTWITRIMINECLLRLKKRGKIINMEDEKIENMMSQSQTPRSSAGKALNDELKTILHDALHRLPEIYRTVFVMREVENMSVAETQYCLNISDANVKVRLNRAKAMLKDLLSSYYNKEDIFHFHLSRCDKMVDAVMKHLRSS